MSRPPMNRPTTSSITDTAEVRTERKIVVTMSQDDMDNALIEWAKKNLNFNPPEGADVEVEVREEGNDDYGTEGPAFARLTVAVVTNLKPCTDCGQLCREIDSPRSEHAADCPHCVKSA